MKCSRISTMMLAMAAAAAISGAADADEPDDYLLLCRGGNNSFEMYSKMHTIRESVRVTATYLTVNFRRSAGKASEGLTNGYCAWADRGVRADEPNVIRMQFLGTWVIINAQTSGDKVRSKAPLTPQQPSVTYEVQGSRGPAAELSALLRALQEGTDFQVHVHNNDDGALVMSKFGP